MIRSSLIAAQIKSPKRHAGSIRLRLLLGPKQMLAGPTVYSVVNVVCARPPVQEVVEVVWVTPPPHSVADGAHGAGAGQVWHGVVDGMQVSWACAARLATENADAAPTSASAKSLPRR